MTAEDRYSEFFRIGQEDEANDGEAANHCAAEAQALMDVAEKPDCTPEERYELLRDAFALLDQPLPQTPAFAEAFQRLRRLVGDQV